MTREVIKDLENRPMAEGEEDIVEQGEQALAEPLAAEMAEAPVQIEEEVAPPDLSYLEEFFDPAFYRMQNGDLAKLAKDQLFAHFLENGWQEGRDPSPEFSVSLYLDKNPDVRDAAQNPLAHYHDAGAAEGRDCYLSNWGTTDAPIMLATMLDQVAAVFDADFYRKNNPDISALSDRALAAQFTSLGWLEGRNPSADFSVKDYLLANEDVADARVNPFLHYLQCGKNEERRVAPPAPTTVARESSDADLRNVAKLFDPIFYRQTYSDVPGSDADLIRHYMTYGWREGRDPNREFSTNFYLSHNPDIAAGGLNPFLHFTLSGRAEGRKCHPSADNPCYVSSDELAALSDADVETVIREFDPSFYRRMNEDLTGGDDELLLHFMTRGWRENRDPKPGFSTQYYTSTYPDIAAGKINPFLHFILFGRTEGRRPHDEEPIAIALNRSANLVPDHLAAVLAGPKQGIRPVNPPVRVNTDTMEIHWVIPDFSRGGGGHMTIFRMIRHLETFGHTCVIWIEEPDKHIDANKAYEDIIKYFQCVRADVRFVKNGFYEIKGDFVVATGWSTAFIVDAAPGFARKLYFVQDHEPEFYPTGTEAILARQTYDFDFGCICASPWLAKIMTERYGRWARSFELSYDDAQYCILDKAAHDARFTARPQSQPIKIAVYARDHTARRCVSLALMALQVLAGQRGGFEVHFFGQNNLPFDETPFPAMDHGVLDTDRLAALYNKCDIGICFSATNYSLVPQEMMACGLPLIELNTSSTRAIFPDDTVTLAGPNPHDIAQAIAALIDSPKARAKQMSAALEWIEQSSWENSARAIEAAMRSYAHEMPKLPLPAIATANKVRLDIVIPTFNGIKELKPVIAALRSQSAVEQTQIFCVDSNSSDGTTEWLRGQPDIALTVIEQSEFQHGRTRNQGAGQGKADYVAFLTQDAIPTGPNWANDIMMMMDHYPNAAGLFGRHQPYAHHPKFIRDEITKHFANMLNKPLAVSRFTDPDRWAKKDQGWRQFLHFYSDNNSAMRRQIWQDLPYPEIDYGEDQVWARDIIEAGYTKLYAPTACVFHSHDYDPAQTFERARIEGAFFRTHFGYRLGDGSDEEVAARITREQSRFKAWASKNGTPTDEIELRQANIKQKICGWRAGLIDASAQIQTGKNRPDADAG